MTNADDDVVKGRWRLKMLLPIDKIFQKFCWVLKNGKMLQAGAARNRKIVTELIEHFYLSFGYNYRKNQSEVTLFEDF